MILNKLHNYKNDRMVKKLQQLITNDKKEYVIEIEDNVAVIKELNTYAGSITPISKMVVNLVNAGIKKEDALKMATLNPARLMGYDNIGDIKEGYLADLNILDENLNIKTTIFKGEVLPR